MSRSPFVAVPVLISAAALLAAAGASIAWKKSDVVAVVLVKPSIGGFVPVEGSAIGNTWAKSDVQPVLLVEPGIGGFRPLEGSSIGNIWRKRDVLPAMLVEPSVGGFVPLGLLSSPGEGATGLSPTLPTQSAPAVIETRIDGDFEGWEGETVVRLMNGQVWQQTEFHFHYHYAFMPRVLIYRSGGGYKMKVDGVEKAVGVTRLR